MRPPRLPAWLLLVVLPPRLRRARALHTLGVVVDQRLHYPRGQRLLGGPPCAEEADGLGACAGDQRGRARI